MDSDFLITVETTADILTKNNLMLSVAESCTGGYISHLLTSLPGSSKFFAMAIVCYSVDSKKSMLDISSSTIKKYGVVSEETAIEMANSVRRLTRTDVSLSITGIAGPETIENKDIGLMYIAVSIKDHIESKGIKLVGDREEIIKQASHEALKYLFHILRLWA
jgi:PncC family amidohydrolase